MLAASLQIKNYPISFFPYFYYKKKEKLQAEKVS